MNSTPRDNKGTVEGVCLIRSVDVKTSSKGDSYLDMDLGDSNGAITAKLWNYSEARYGIYSANQIVKVRGTISVYNGNDQFRVEMIRPANESDGVNMDSLVKSAAISGEAMYNELLSLAENFFDNDLSKIVCTVLKDYRLPLLYWPAAFRLHHAIRGGLLLHTLSIVKMCQSVCAIYPFINRDLLLAGAILHDIAKIAEFDVADSGIANGYTIKGNLIGHLVEGAIVVREAAKKCGVGEEKSNLLEHMLISHHGEPDFGAAVRPAFIEAEVLSEIDMLDARLYEMREAVSGVDKGEFTGKIWSMDNRKLYNHGLSDLSDKLNLGL